MMVQVGSFRFFTPPAISPPVSFLFPTLIISKVYKLFHLIIKVGTDNIILECVEVALFDSDIYH